MSPANLIWISRMDRIIYSGILSIFGLGSLQFCNIVAFLPRFCYHRTASQSTLGASMDIGQGKNMTGQPIHSVHCKPTADSPRILPARNHPGRNHPQRRPARQRHQMAPAHLRRGRATSTTGSAPSTSPKSSSPCASTSAACSGTRRGFCAPGRASGCGVWILFREGGG